jgi:hypothetical protein
MSPASTGIIKRREDVSPVCAAFQLLPGGHFMIESAQVLFRAWLDQIPQSTDALEKQVRAILGPDLIAQMTVAQHKALTTEIEIALKRAVASFLGPFNNVGCVLKGPIVGFSITPKYLSTNKSVAIDIARNSMDYVDMWRDAALPRSASGDAIVAMAEEKLREVRELREGRKDDPR